MLQFSTISRRLAVAATVALAASACSDSNTPGTGTSQVSVQLTDAPGNIQEAVVTVSEIYLQGGGNGRVTLEDTPFTTDLTDLANSTQLVVDGVDVPSANYSELRFVITGAYIRVDNGDGTSSVYATSPDYSGLPAGVTADGELQTPSFNTSGLKVQLPAEALSLDDESVTYLVDFDVYQSFGHEAGDRWVMHPVIKGAQVTAAGNAVVRLSLGDGVTLPSGSLGDFTATLTNGDGTPEVVTFSDANLDGTWEANFGALLPGDYGLTITGPAGVTFTTAPVAPSSITVSENATSETTLVIDSAV